MKTRLILLLSNDRRIEEQFCEAADREGAQVLVNRRTAEALATACARLNWT